MGQRAVEHYGEVAKVSEKAILIAYNDAEISPHNKKRIAKVLPKNLTV